MNHLLGHKDVKSAKVEEDHIIPLLCPTDHLLLRTLLKSQHTAWGRGIYVHKRNHYWATSFQLLSEYRSRKHTFFFFFCNRKNEYFLKPKTAATSRD